MASGGVAGGKSLTSDVPDGSGLTVNFGWRPIETAPKNQTVFIACEKGSDWVYLCAWWPLGNPEIASWVKCDGRGDGEPHVVYCGSDPGSEVWWVSPTHWMPIPEPPQ